MMAAETFHLDVIPDEKRSTGRMWLIPQMTPSATSAVNRRNQSKLGHYRKTAWCVRSTMGEPTQ